MSHVPRLTGRITGVTEPFTKHATRSTLIATFDTSTRAHRLSLAATFDADDPHYATTAHTYPVIRYSERINNPAPCTDPQCPARSL